MAFEIVVLFCLIGTPAATCDEAHAVRVLRGDVITRVAADCGRIGLLLPIRRSKLRPKGTYAIVRCRRRDDAIDAAAPIEAMLVLDPFGAR